jgi:nitrate reductase gamma subunit
LLVIKVLILDALLQRRLHRRSKIRWVIHGLIFFPLVFRFTWGLVALTCSLTVPEWPGCWSMLDKNNPITAFLFDLSGIMILVGIAFALMRKAVERSEKLPGLPGQDWLAVSLLGGIVTIGFTLEGMRIAMTGNPTGAEYAFIGNALSLFFGTASGVTDIYGYLWYVHAVLTGAFAAYLPFSRMLHIVVAPVTLAVNAALQSSRMQEERLLQNHTRKKD